MATNNPNPLPVPAPLDQTSVNLYAAANATGGYDPHVVAAAAVTSPDVSSTVTAAQGAAAQTVTSDAVTTLADQTAQVQRQQWNSMPAQVRQQFLDAGYKPVHNPSRSIFGDIVHYTVGELAQPFHDAAQVAGMGLRATQHALRAASLVIGNPSEAVAARLPDTGIGRAFSLSDWADAWNQTEHGQQFLDPVYKNDAYKMFGDQITNLAVAQVTGKPLNQILAPYQNNPDQLKAVSQLMGSAQYRKAVAYLDAAHVSPGRAIVGPSFIANHPALGHALSGSIDGWFDWYTDPLMRAGIAIKASRDVKYLANTPGDVQRLYDRYQSVKDATREMADLVAAGSPSALLDKYGPTYAPLITRLLEEKADTPEKVLAAWKSDVGVTTFINGTPTSTPLASGGTLPHVNLLSPDLGTKLQKVINWAEEAPARRLGLTTADLTPDAYTDASTGLDGFLAGMGATARRLATTIPAARRFDPADPSSLVTIRQIAQMFLPAAAVDKYLTAWYQAGDLSQKWKVYRSLMINLGEAANFGKDRELWGTYLDKFAQNLNVVYDGAGADIAKIDGVDSRAGIGKYHMSTTWAVPDFRTAYLDANRAALLSHLTGSVNHEGMDKAMAIWRGLTLTRGGFGFRVALEEVANLALRATPITYVKGLAGTFMAANARRLAAERAAERAAEESNPTYSLERIERAGSPTTPSPHGIYFAIRHPGVTNPWALSKGPNDVSRLAQGTARRAYKVELPPDAEEAGLLGSTTGHATLQKQIGEAEYRRLSKMSDEEVARHILAQHPDLDPTFLKSKRGAWLPKEQTMETLAAENARAEGYDALIGLNTDPAAAGWDEYVALNDSALTPPGTAIPAQTTRLSDLPDQSALTAWQRETSHLRQSVVDAIHTPADLYRAKLLDLIARASGHVAAPNMAQVIDDQIASGNADANMAAALSHHGYDHANLIDPINARTVRVKIGQKMVNAELSRTGDFRTWGKTETLFDHIWYDQLANLARDDWLRPALIGAGLKGSPKFRADLLASRIKRVADTLQADPMWKQLSHRASFDSAGHSVEAGQITERQAAEDHARKIIAHVDNLVTSPRGTRIGNLPEYKIYETSGVKYDQFLSKHLLANGKPPSLAALAQVDIRDKPALIAGPDLVPIASSRGATLNFIDKFFTKVTAPQMNWLSRQPQWWHFLADSYKAYEPMTAQWRAAGMEEDQVLNLLRDNARARALNQILPYVHNPELRSQMAALTRNLAPFWFAQEQFYKRWARVFVHSPAAFRKAELMSSGIRHSGVVHTDPTSGQQYFVYPGSQAVQAVLTHTLGRFMPGGTQTLPFGLTGRLNMLSPGLTDRIGAPSFSPLVVIPMNAIKQIDPHLTRAINDLEGPIAANTGYLKALLPTTIERALEFALPSSINGAAHASAVNQAIQAVEASGHGIGQPALHQVASTSIPNPRPGDYVLEGAAAKVYQPDGRWVLNDAHTQQAYMTRIKNAARIILLTRLVYGFAAPASPETQFNPSNLHNDFAKLMNTLPPEQAIPVFLAQHPDASPYTVFQSTNTLGGFLPATAAAMNFLSSNSKLVSSHAPAAVYFIPPAAANAPYNANVYTEQLAEGLRIRKDPQQFYDEIVYQNSANIYFAAENEKNKLISAGTMPRSEITAQWEDFSQRFMAANPIFAHYYQSTIPGARYQREAIMADVGAALSDGSAPKTAQSAAIANLYQSYVAYQSLTSSPPGNTQPSPSEVLQVSEQYAQFLARYVADNPGVKPLVDRAIRPDLTAAMDALANQGQAVVF